MKRSLRNLLKRTRHFVVHRVLSLDDTPHRIALGVAIGLFVAWTPTPGIQMILTLIIAALLRANKVVGLPCAWISNPATFWIYIPNYVLGCWLTGKQPNEQFKDALNKAFGDCGLFERCQQLGHVLWDVFAPLMLGSVIIGLLVGAIGYVATYYGVGAYRTHRRKVQQIRLARRAAKAAARNAARSHGSAC